MPPLCRTKHNRAKPMFESASALFSIADAGEFRFARFYIVCEEVPLGTPESPPIVSGVSDMHPADCQNVEETRNLMQTFSWKFRWIFGSKNVAFLTSRMFASSMIRVFPSLEHSTDCVRKPADNFRTFVCVPCGTRQQMA